MLGYSDSQLLAARVCQTLQDVLLHQRQRWGKALLQKVLDEQWWLREFATALDSLCWDDSLPGAFGVLDNASLRSAFIGKKKSEEPPTKNDLVHPKALAHLIFLPRTGELIDRRGAPRIFLDCRFHQVAVDEPLKAFQDMKATWKPWERYQFRKTDMVIGLHLLLADASAASESGSWARWSEYLADLNEKYPWPESLQAAQGRTIAFPLSEQSEAWVRLDLFALKVFDPWEQGEVPNNADPLPATGDQRRKSTDAAVG